MKCGRQSNLVSTTTIFRASTKFKNGIPTFLKFNADTAKCRIGSPIHEK